MKDKKTYALNILKYGDEVYPNQITTLFIRALECDALTGEDIEDMLTNNNSEAYGKAAIILAKAGFFVPDRILKGFPAYYAM